jgi:urea transport system substrate-binding protein
MTEESPARDRTPTVFNHNSPRKASVGVGSRDVVDVALVVPLGGSAGIFGPSCELCGQLAAEEINAEAGVLGRELRLSVIDGGRPPHEVADELGAAVAAGLVDAVVGWHISAVRLALLPRVAGYVPYVYTALYEGGEHTPGVFLTGETPSRQLLPAMRWLRQECGVRRWCIVGNDYIWPRRTARSARVYAEVCRGEICGEMFVPLGARSFADAVTLVGRSHADAVIMLLVGQDAVRFNRAFARAGLDRHCRRLSALIDENTLVGSGVEATNGICAAAAYFETLATPESLDFGRRYAERFGADAPMLSAVGESCYAGVLMLSALARRADSLDVGAMTDRGRVAVVRPARSGEAQMTHDRHLDQRVYLAEAVGLGFGRVTELEPPRPGWGA